MADLIGILVGAGAVISVLVEILKKTPFPTDKPKLVVLITALLAVIITQIARDAFTLANVDLMVAEIAAIYGSAVVIYETLIKPIVTRFSKK